MVVTDALRQVRRLALCGASVLVLGGMQGCQMFGWFQDPPPDPYRSLQVEAALDVNPDIHGRPSPVILTIYQLSDAKAFLAADPASLLEPDAEPASPAWLKRETFQLRPGEELTRRFVPEPAVQLFGAVAEYRDLENAQWRTVEVFHGQTPESLQINLQRTRVSIRLIPLQGEASSVEQ